MKAPDWLRLRMDRPRVSSREARRAAASIGQPGCKQLECPQGAAGWHPSPANWGRGSIEPSRLRGGTKWMFVRIGGRSQCCPALTSPTSLLLMLRTCSSTPSKGLSFEMLSAIKMPDALMPA